MRPSILALAGVTIAAAVALALAARPPAPPAAVRIDPAPAESGEPAPFTGGAWTVSESTLPTEAEPSVEVEPTKASHAGRARHENRSRDEVVPAVPEDTPRRAPRTSGSPEEFLSDALFRRLDADGDGVLRGDEIPTALRGAARAGGAIDRAAFATLFLAAVQNVRAGSADLPTVATAASQTAMPAWFDALDTDRDGQVSLYEWRAAGRSIAEFQKIDADGDGLLTRREVQAFVAQSKTAAPTPGAAPGPRAGSEAPGTASAGEPSTPHATSPSGKKPADVLFGHYVAVAASAPAKASAPAAPARPAMARPAAPAALAGVPAPAKPAAPVSPPLPPETATTPLPLTGVAYWVARDAENLTHLARGEHPNALFLGDSITDLLRTGAGAPLWNAYYAPLGALDFAVGGARTSQVLWQIETGQVALAAPKVVVLMIGTNNLALGQDPDEVAAGIEKIVKELGAQLPRTRVLLLGILPRSPDPADPFRAEIARVNARIAELADGARVSYLDIGKLFLAADGSLPRAVMPDGLHPSLFGYALYSSAVWPALMDLLKE